MSGMAEPRALSHLTGVLSGLQLFAIAAPYAVDECNPPSAIEYAAHDPLASLNIEFTAPPPECGDRRSPAPEPPRSRNIARPPVASPIGPCAPPNQDRQAIGSPRRRTLRVRSRQAY